jgi:molecular chaperone DnaJ
MDLNTDYYTALGALRTDEDDTIKKKYYKMSMKLHPDRGGDAQEFARISEAYSVLGDPNARSDYDRRSRFGRDYDESQEMLNYKFDNLAKAWKDGAYEDFMKNEVLNVIVRVDDDFDGTVEYERMVTCKKCDGTGKDSDNRIQIKDESGRVVKVFEADGGCDFCEGTGKGWNGDKCGFCMGHGKVGAVDCTTCGGQRRVVVKNRVKGVRFKDGSDEIKLEFLGNHSRDIPGRVGHLWVVRKKD